jgi:hypothetical protein
MERRILLSAVAGSCAAAAGSVALFKPEVVVGSPRGEGKPVSTERSRFEGTVQYRPEPETVRWSSAEEPDGPEDYTAEPFEEWASREVEDVAADAVTAAVRERIDTELPSIVATSFEEYVGTTIVVGADIHRRTGNENLSKVPESTFVDAAPRSVEATVRLDGREHTQTMPVFVEDGPPVVLA